MLMLRSPLVTATTLAMLLLGQSATFAQVQNRLTEAPSETASTDGLIGEATPFQLAQSTPEVFYQNPANSLGAPAGTTSTGRRGSGQQANCNSLKPGALTLLAPVDHPGVTASGRPTFFWYLGKIPSAARVEFTLQEAEGPRPSVLIRKTIEKPKAGINRLKMPADIPELIPGQKYYWSVDLACNPNQPMHDNNIFVETDFRRAETNAVSPEVIAKLQAAESERDRAAVYAQAGYWYDALSNLLAAREQTPSNAALKQSYLSLLEQVGLTEVAKQERQRL